MKNIIWDLFKETGDIKYYILLSKMERCDNNEGESRGNNTKWD